MAPAATPVGSAWTDAAALGQSLYYGTRAFEQSPRVAGATLPLADAACVRCHGALGEGTRESNLAAPPLRLSASAPERPLAQALGDALAQGIGLNGRPLSQVMPRYVLGDVEHAALQAFLPWLGRSDAPVRGVSDSELHLGVALEGLASRAARLDVEAGLRSVFQAVNEGGGVHGRQLRLMAVTDADADVLALVGSAPGATLRSHLAAGRLPSLASLALEADDVTRGDWTVPLLPSLRRQAREAWQLLGDAATDCTRWLIDPSGWLTVADTGPVTRWPDRPQADARDICVVSLVPAAELDRVRAQWSAQGLVLRSLVELAWLRPSPLEVPGLDHRLVLPAPTAVAELAASQGRSIWFEWGAAAARIAVEALARSGRVLQPERLMAQARGMSGFEPVAQAPIFLNRQQTHGWNPQPWPATTPPVLQARGGPP
jgi:cytochrome c553